MDASNVTGQPTSSHRHQLSSTSILHDRYVQNTLRPVALDAASLDEILTELQAAIVKGVQIIREHTGNERTDSDRKDSIYVGHTGIALTLLRLFAQSKSLGLTSPSHLLALLSSFQDQSFGNSHIPPSTHPADLIRSYLPSIRPHHPRQNRLSPLDSSFGPALVYILTNILYPDENWSGAGGKTVAGMGVRGAGYDYGQQDRRASYALGEVASSYYAQEPEPDPQWDAAMLTLRRAVQYALKDNTPGNDEVLYGRAGLLAGLLNLRVWLGLDNGGASVSLTPQRKEMLVELVGDDVIGGMVDKIVDAGEEGRRKYERTVGQEGLPLMWEWHGKWYLGAVHGAAGILTVLLQSPRHLIAPYLSIFTSCISSLCALTVAYNGHLPTALPASLKLSRYTKDDLTFRSQSPEERPARSNLVQLCHGSPGLLLLLATMRTRFPVDYERTKRKARARSKSKSTPGDQLDADVLAESNTRKGRRSSEGRHAFQVTQVDWSEAERLASDRIWEEGLLRKGLGLCHGVSGNGWVFLLSNLSCGFDPDSNADLALSRSLAFLLHSTHLPPMPPLDPALHDFSIYRRADHPYSLFEGLAGAICAWADACVVIKERLEGMKAGKDSQYGGTESRKTASDEGEEEVVEEEDEEEEEEEEDDLYVSSSHDEHEAIKGGGGDEGWGTGGVAGGGGSGSRAKGKQRERGNRRDRRAEREEREERARIRERDKERGKERGQALVLGIPGLGGARIRGIL